MSSWRPSCHRPLISNTLTAVAIFLFVILICKHVELLTRISDQQVAKVEVPKHTSSGNPKPSERLVEMYKRQAAIEVANRQKFLEKANSSFARIYNNMAPEVFCAELVKIGTTDDGGKWMCGPFDLPQNCTIFSLGLANDITFEEDIQMITQQRCRIFSFDAKEQIPEVKKRLKEIRAEATAVNVTKVSNPGKGEYTLAHLMEVNEVDKIEILKIDIEKSEFGVMEDFLDKHQVSQIMIEVHGSPQQTLDLLRMFSRKGYRLFNYEINGAYHILCEYALIHESVLDRYGATMLAKFLT